jgi:hypothetical protein
MVAVTCLQQIAKHQKTLNLYSSMLPRGLILAMVSGKDVDSARKLRTEASSPIQRYGNKLYSLHIRLFSRIVPWIPLNNRHNTDGR